MYITVWTIVIGFFVGLIARALSRQRQEGGFILTTALGISGSLIGSIIGRALGMYGPQDPISLVMSVVGAAISLLAYNRYFASTRPAAR